MKYLRWVIFLVLSLFLFASFYVVVQKVVKIKDINCSSQFGPCDNNLQAAINLLQTKHKSIFDTRNDLNSIVKKDGQVLDFSVRFKLPNDFEVNVIERKPVVAFVDTSSSDFILVDMNGNILGKTSKTVLPIVKTTLNLGNGQLVYIANLVSSLYTFYSIKNANVSADGITIDGINGKEVIFPLYGDRDLLLGSLALILSRLPSVKEASTIRVIDLRYKNPVLR